MNIGGGTAHVGGQFGYRWSRVSRSITGAYTLYIYPTTVYPSYGNDGRFNAFPLRCLCMLERSSIGYSMSRVVVRLWHLLSWLELLDSLDDKSSTTSRTTTLDIDSHILHLTSFRHLTTGLSHSLPYTLYYLHVHYNKPRL